MAKKIYYIGGSPCSGKSTVAERIAKEYGVYHFKADDFLGAALSFAASSGLQVCKRVSRMTADEIWMRSAEEQCEEEFLIYEEIKQFIFKKLNEVEADVVVAEGAAFTPDIMKSCKYDYMCIVPSAEFQVTNYRQRDWIWYVLKDCKDKEAAFENWMQRDILFAKRVKAACEERGVPCIVNDGTISEEEMFERVKAILDIR